MTKFHNQSPNKKNFNSLKKNQKISFSKTNEKIEFENNQVQNKNKQVQSKITSAFFKKKLLKGYSKIHELKLVTIGLASPEKIQSWAEKELPNGKIFGEVTNANTFHYRTFKPSKGGLFCERIFGPLKDFECACGKRQKPNALESRQILEHEQTTRYFCTNCDVEYTWSIIRRYQLGYIQLNAPVAHLWYFKANPSYLSILFDMKRKDLFSILYCTDTITIENMWKSAERYSTFNRTPTDLYLTWQKFLNFEEKMKKFELFYRTKKQKRKKKKLLFQKTYFSQNQSISKIPWKNFPHEKVLSAEFSQNFTNEFFDEKPNQSEFGEHLSFNLKSSQKRLATFQTIAQQKQKTSFYLLFQKIWKKMIQDTYRNTCFFNCSTQYTNTNFQTKFVESFQLFFFFSKNSKNIFEFSLFLCSENQEIETNFDFQKVLNNFSSILVGTNGDFESQKTRNQRKKLWSLLLFSFQFALFLLVQKNKKQKSQGSFSKKDLLFLINIIPFLQKISKFEKETSFLNKYQKLHSFYVKTFLMKHTTQFSSGLPPSRYTNLNVSNFNRFTPKILFQTKDEIGIGSKKQKEIFSFVFSKILKNKQFEVFQKEIYCSLNKNTLLNIELKKTFSENQKKKFLKNFSRSLEKLFLFFKFCFEVEVPFLYILNQNGFENVNFPNTNWTSVSNTFEIKDKRINKQFSSFNKEEFEKIALFIGKNSKLPFVFETIGFQYFSLLFFFLFSFDFSQNKNEKNQTSIVFSEISKEKSKNTNIHKPNRLYRDFFNCLSVFSFKESFFFKNFSSLEKRNSLKKQKNSKIKIANKCSSRKSKYKKRKNQLSFSQFEKFQPFLWIEDSDQTNRSFSSVSSIAFLNSGGIETKNMQKKQMKKYKQNPKVQKNSFLQNSVLTISYNYVWTNDSDWKYFVYYNSFFFSEFGDIPIFCYKSLASDFSTILGSEFHYFQKTLFSSNSGVFQNQRTQKKTMTYVADDNYSSFVPDFFASSNKHFFVGAGIVEKFLTEYTSNELKKMTKQHQILLPKIHQKIRILKQTAKTKKDFLKIQKYFQKREHIIRRLKFLRKFFRRNSNPTYLILRNLPVLPPDLRPILKLQNQIAASDLNRFYQRILYRNERFQKFAKDSATNQSFEMKYAQRLLQEAVDNLIQNGKGNGKAETNSRGQPLKSLSEILKGKQGRFRQYLLGKRVDYSGRSVIVVGPKLKLYECGIPKEMAFELFLPFLIQQVLQYKLAQTVVGAKNLLKSEHNLALNLLNKVMKNIPVLLNRAPTLHRLGFQAFLPKLIEGRAILLHPMVCPGFNADFDGDQMAVHIPLTVEARTEAWKFMLATNNLINAATGEPVILPSQDMVLGCFYLTTDFSSKSVYIQISNSLKTEKFENFQQMKSKNKAFLFFQNIQNILLSFQKKQISLHTPIWLRWNSRVNCGNDIAKPVEIRLVKNGQWQLISQKSTIFYTNKNRKYCTYIRTTVGRILMNCMIQECIQRKF
jgi:DNA-directed RNA polymerase beta' subunit